MYYGYNSVECLNYRLDEFEEEVGSSGKYRREDNVGIPFTESSLNPEELALFANNPAALEIYLILGNEAVSQTQSIYGSHPDNGEANAFQHAYWSALLTKQFGEDFAKNLTDAHEQNYGEPNSHFMDYHNNEVGRMIATGEYGSLVDAVRIAVSSGQTIMLDENGNVLYTNPTDPD